MSTIEEISRGLGDAIVPGTTSTIRGLAIHGLASFAQKAGRYSFESNWNELESEIRSRPKPSNCRLSTEEFDERKRYLMGLMSTKLRRLYSSYLPVSNLGMVCKVKFTEPPTALYAAVCVSGRKLIYRKRERSGTKKPGWRNHFSLTDFGIVSLGELAQSQSTEIGISAAPISAVWDQGPPTGGWDDRGGSSIKMEYPNAMTSYNHGLSEHSYWDSWPYQMPLIKLEQEERALVDVSPGSSIKPEQQDPDLNSIPPWSRINEVNIPPWPPINEEPPDDDDPWVCVPIATERTNTYVKPEPKDDDDGIVTSYLDSWQSTQQPEPSTEPGTAASGLAPSNDPEPDRQVPTEDATLGVHDNDVDSADIMAALLEALNRQEEEEDASIARQILDSSRVEDSGRSSLR